MTSPVRNTRRYTYADYLEWPESERCEIIDGEVFSMAAAPTRRHQEVLVEILRQVANSLEGKPCRAFVAPFDVRLSRANESDAQTDTVVQPDLLVVCDAEKLDERGLRGAPDWVIEVLSPASAVHDQTTKLRAYERAGVPEVWLVHPTDQLITVYRLSGTSYARPLIYPARGVLACASVTDVSVDFTRVFPAAA